ncbi:hypothetical protein AC1031_000827 [Aphanomyces cochlioides]|nr:hypothetical protein AC1031_000827 [Aphanomyces cochlioides]
MERLLVHRQPNVEDWSDDFTLEMLQAHDEPNHPMTHLDLTAMDEKEDDDEDWDQELLSSREDTTQTREENNLSFRVLLESSDAPDSASASTKEGGGLPDSCKLVACALHCFNSKLPKPRESVFPPATPLLTLEADGFPCYTDKRLEEWLQHLVPSKEQAAMNLERTWSDVNRESLLLDLSSETFHRFSQVLSYYVRRNRTEDAVDVFRAFGNCLEEQVQELKGNQDSLHMSEDEWRHIRGGWSIETLQIAVEACRPPDHIPLFVGIMKKIIRLFPTWKSAAELVECRYVAHHWEHFQSNSFLWQSLTNDKVLSGNFATECASGQELLTRYVSLFKTLVNDERKLSRQMSMAISAGLGMLSVSCHPVPLQVLVLCDIQSLVEKRSPIDNETIPNLFIDEQVALKDGSEPENSNFELFHPENTHLRMEWLESVYVKLSMPHDTMIKAKCAHTISRCLLTHLESWPLCESLAMEGLRLLDIGYTLSFPKGEGQRHGLMGYLGRDIMETLGAVLTNTKKYRFAIAAYEAAQQLYCFQYITRRGYEKLDRVCSSLCLQNGDLDRALQYHDRVLQWTKEHENCNEFVYISQMINSILLQQCQFRLAEHRLHDALIALRDPQAILPPPFVKSAPRRFHFKFQSSGYDGWFLHDIQLHLCLRDVFKACGRGQEALHILQHLLSYEPKFKLPRGKRLHITMMVAEDALKLRQLELCISMLRVIEHDATSENEAGIQETKLAWDVMCSFRYLKCRARCYFYKAHYHRCALWLAVASSKSLTIRQRADIDALNSRCMLQLYLKQLKESEDPPMPMQRSASGRWCFSTQEPSLGLLLNKKEQEMFQAAMEDHWNIRSYAEACATYCWKAFDLYGTLNDSARQLKMILTLLHLEVSLFDTGIFPEEIPTKSIAALEQAMTHVKQALQLATATAMPMKMLQTFVFMAEIEWHWRRLDPSRNANEMIAAMEEALRLLHSIYLRRVQGSHNSIHVVPLLPFTPSILMHLEHIVGKLLIFLADLARSQLFSPKLFTWSELESAYYCLNQCVYLYSTQPNCLSQVEEAAPVHPRPSNVQLSRHSQHQKQLSLSAISDMMSFSMFRPTDSFSCDVQDVPPSLFAYVEPIKPSKNARRIPSPQPRSRSQSAPAYNETSIESKNVEWDDTDLEIEPDGEDFWRACDQENRNQHMMQWLRSLYVDMDELWGFWFNHSLGNQKYKTGRLTQATFRLASLKLIFDVQEHSNPCMTRICLPQSPGLESSWGVFIHDRDRISVLLHPPTTPSVELFAFPASSASDWQRAVASVPYGSMSVTQIHIKRVLGYLGPKVFMKAISSILLENPLIVVHPSMSVVQEVLFVLVYMLRPFRWHYSMFPALPMTATNILVELIHSYTEGKTKRRPNAPLPFLAGISPDMWRECTYRLSASSSCSTCISVLQVDVIGKCKFQRATNRAYAIDMQPKLRRFVVDAISGSGGVAALESLQEVYRVIVQSFQRPASFKQWFRLESQEFTKLFFTTTTCQAFLKGDDKSSVV